MAFTTGVLLFDGAEELDFAGPYEVFGAAAHLSGEDRVCTVAEELREIRCAKGLKVVPELACDAAPALDVLVVPGGQGTRREVGNERLLRWLRDRGERARFATSVCTGSFLLHASGLAANRRVTTHWENVNRLRERGNVTVLDDVRFVRDGNVVTAAGVSAGIDMALWIVGQLRGPEFARKVQRYIEYSPAPPYAAEV